MTNLLDALIVAMQLATTTVHAPQSPLAQPSLVPDLPTCSRR